MKKYILTSIILLLAAANTAWGQVAKIGDTPYTTLAEAVTAATAGQTIELIDDVTLTSTISINKGITIDGGGHSVSSSSANPFTLSGFNTSETNSVTFNNVNINATGSSGRGIEVNQFAGTLTLTGCTLTVGQRGVTYGASNKNIDLVISNTTIQNCSVSDPTKQYVNNEHQRGISIWTTNSTPDNTVTLTNTIIKGFAYCINVAGGGTGTEVTMNGGDTYGRAAINNFTSNGVFTLNGVKVYGLNNQTGPTERFGCIVDNSGMTNNVYNVTDCKFYAIISDAALTEGGNAAEMMFALRGQNSVANIHGNTTYSSTCPDESRAGLIEIESQLVPAAEGGLNNKFVFDADAQQSLAEEIAKTSITVDADGNGTTSYVAKVVNGTSIKRYTTLPAAFAPTAATDGCTITLLKDVTLSSDVTCPLTDGQSFYLELNGHSITQTKDADTQEPTYIYINKGVTVYTDVEIDEILFALDNGVNGIVKLDNSDATYKYKYTVAEGVAHINGTVYPTLADAVEAATAGQTIVMINDDDASLTSAGDEIIINKPITITGPVDEDGLPLYTIFGSSDGALDDDNFNDLYIKSVTGTVTISNLSFAFFGDEIGSVMGHSPICVGTANNNVVLDNLHINYINCEGIHVNGGTFTIQNCNIDCTRDPDDAYTDYTKGICIVNAATGSITGTTITGVDCNDPDDLSAGIELQGSGDITISGCNIETKTIGISATYVYVDGTLANDQPGTSTVNVSNCTIESTNYSFYGNGYGKEGEGAVINISSGTYTGKLDATIGDTKKGILISGGKYSVRVPMDNIVEGKICPTEANEDNGTMWSLITGSYVARIDDYGYETLDYAVAALEDNDEIILLDDITLDADITCNLEDGDALAITFGTFDITKGDYSVLLPTGVSVITDKSTDIFSALVDGKAILEEVETVGEDVVYTYSVADAVAKIAKTVGEETTYTYYASLEDAIAAVPTDGTQTTITMIDNETVAEGVSLTVPATKNIVLDLNGKTVTGSSTTVSPNFYFITNKGTLEITDSSTGASGKITYGCTNPNPGYTNEYVTICNEGGSFTLTKGTIENTSGGLSYAVNNRSVAQGTATFNLNGGTVSAPSGDAAVRVYQSVYNASSPYDNIVNVTGGTILDNGIFVDSYIGNNVDGSNSHLTVNISGGTVNGLIDYKLRHPYNTSLNITDGTFGNSRFRVRKYTSEWKGSAEPTAPIVTISGGKFTFADGVNPFALTNEGDGSGTTWTTYQKAYNVSDGLFSKDLNDYPAIQFPTGNIGVANTDPATKDDYPYTVGGAAAMIGEVSYGTLEAALAAAQDGETITLLKNTSGSGLFIGPNKFPTGLTIDFKTFTYTVNTPVGSTNTVNQALHFEQGNKITLTNGGIKMTDDATELAAFQMFMQNYGTLIIDGMSLDGTGIAVATYASSYGTPWGGTTKPQFNYNTAGESVIRNSTITMTGDLGIDDAAGLTIEDDAVINVNAIATKGTDARYASATPTITVENGAKFKLADASKAAALETLLNTNDQSLGTAVNGVYTVQNAIYVASITVGGTTTKYTSLEAAFAAVEDGQTINMLTDVTLSNPLNINVGTKAVTLDLGGKTLTGRTNLKQGNVTIKNGTVAGGAQQALNVYGSADSSAENYSVLTIASDATVTADVWGVCMFGATAGTNGYGAVININGTVHTTGNGSEGAVFVSGNLGNNIEGDMKNVINITGSITSDTDAAIALNGNATVNVKDGAVITGNTAIAIKRGTLNVVEGATVHATGLSNIPPSGNMNGTEMSGAAISMTNTYNSYGPMQVNISGGSFTSDHAMALFKEDDTYANDAKYSVSGGIFNTPVPEEFCADGYVPTSITTQGFTQYTVEPGDFVAQIGDTKYTTLAAAVAAVPTNGLETTITLLKDIELVNNVVVGGTYGTTPKITTAITNQNVKLDLNGHNITGEKTLYLAGGSLNITGTGSITSNSVDVAPVGVRYVKTDNYPDLDYTSKRTLTIGSDVTLTGAQYGLNIFGTNEPTTANNIDVTVDGKVNGMLFVLGNLSNANNNIVINVSGTVDASQATGSEKVHTGIALCGNASVHIIDGAVVKGESGIEVRAGELIMDGDIGGTITATSADYSYTTNGSGTTVKGAAIAVAQHGTKAATSATILGGTLTGAKKIAVIDAQTNSLAGVTVIADDDFLTNSATETVLPDGYYWLSNGDGTSSPAPNSHVAQIGNTLYATLEAAVAAVQDGETIKLLDDISLTDRLFVNAGATPAYDSTSKRYATTTENKSFTLDLNGHNITSSSNIALAGGSLNITNTGDADATHGVISSTNAGLAPIEVRGTGNLTQKRTLTVGTGVTLTGAEYGLNVFGSNDAQKNLIDVNVDGTVNGILFVLGNLSNADNAINVVVNGTVDASNAETGTKPKTGIALNGNANVTVNNGASVTGETGIEVRAGNLIVNGGTITATSADYSYTANGSGTTTKGAAIAVAQHTTTKPINVQLNGGTLTGTELIAVTDVNNNDLEGVSVTAKASFVKNTDTKLPDGFIWVNNENGTYYIGVAPVQIIHVDNSIDSYATLAEAFNNVEDIETIKLIADVALTEDVTLDKPFNLDFNNHTINLNGHTIKLVQGVTIKTNKQTNIFTAADNNYIITVEDSDDPDFPYAYSEKININTANFTVTVTPVTYDGLNHKIGGQNPVTVKIYDVSGEHELNSNNFEITMLPWDSYDAADFNNREEDVYKDAYTYINAITIKGKPEAGYAGSITVDFVIYPRDINDVTVEGQCQPYTETGYTADDNATTGIKKLVTLKYNNIPLVASTTNTIGDYTIDVDATNTYKDTGTYPEAITLTAVEGGNFTGTRKVDFVIGGDKDIAISNITATVVYTGSRQEPTGAGTTPTVIVKDGLTNAVLAQGTDYELEFIEYDESNNYIDYINAKTYTNAVTIRGIGNYYNTKTVDYIITPKNIADCNIIASTTFTGSVINPADAVQVSDPGLSADPPGNQLLAKGTHYTLTVSNGYTYLAPQTYANAITVTGTGNYTGSVTKDFVITSTAAIDLATAAVVLSKQTYTGANLVPTKETTTVTVNGTPLTEGTDYTFSFIPEGDNYYMDAKTYSNAIIIKAKDGSTTYYGTAVGNYIIEPRDLSDADITVTTTALNYLNREQDVTVVVKYGNNVIPATNYTYTPTKVTEAGHYDITITAVENSNLVGSTTADQWVYKTLNGDYAADFTVEPNPIPTQTYTGSEIRPTIVVKDKDRVMQLADANGGDYSVEYTNNINEGEATITITGRYAYSGTITKHFTIVKEYFTVGDFTYHHAKEGEEVNLGKKEGANNVPATTATGKVVVPETVEYPQGHTFTVTGIEEKALGGADITAVVLPQSIAEIEDNAFQGAINTRYVDASAMSGYVPETLTRDFDGPFGGLPKQALVYLTGTNIKGENYVYKPGSGDAYYCELFKIYDDLNGSQTGFDGNDYKWAFENVHKFTAYTVENTRMLTAGKHYTTCLPYSIDIPRNVKAYTLDATSGQIFGFKEVETGTIAAYTPYVLIPSTSGQLLSATDVEVDVFPADANVTETKLNGTVKGNFTFYGTMRYMDGTAAAGKYIMQYKDNKSTWLSIDEGSAGFTNTDNRACILPMRAYIASTGSGARSYTATFTDIDGIIRTETFTLDDEDTVIYDLSGRRVELLEHGHTYIINGKKVIVK